MKKSKLYNSLKNIMKVAFFITLLLMFMQYGGMYVKYMNNYPGGNFYEFMTHQEKDEYNPDLNEGPSERMLESMDDYNRIKNIIYVDLFFFVLFELFSYLSNPDQHWIEILRKRGGEIAETIDKD